MGNETNRSPGVPRPTSRYERLAHLKVTGCVWGGRGAQVGRFNSWLNQELGHPIGYGPVPRSPGGCGTARPETAGYRGPRHF